MTLQHLNSDQRQYFWLSLFLVGAAGYYTVKTGGSGGIFPIVFAVIQVTCAFLIYRQWKFAAWFYLFGFLTQIGWAATHLIVGGYSLFFVAALIGGVLSLPGFYWLRKAAEQGMSHDPANASRDLFELPEEHENRVEALVEAYAKAFGPPQWTHHIVPKQLWLHKYADHVVTIPPTTNRPTWLYGTLLISTMSGKSVELILERPEEDTVGAIGTLSHLTEYYLENGSLLEWNTMGGHPFFGEESEVRGLLFCRPPDSLADNVAPQHEVITLRYVAGITEEQLDNAQAADKEHGDFAGAKALHAELGIARQGIANLSN